MLETERLPRKPRQLSRFMCQELLYEYMIQALDEERYRAVEQHLSYAPELQNELKRMHIADEYCMQLAQTRISVAHLDELKSVRSVAAIVAERVRWSNWPDALKWATQAFAISFVVAMAALVIPWSSFDFKFPKLTATKNIVTSAPDAVAPVQTVAQVPAAPVPAAVPAQNPPQEQKATPPAPKAPEKTPEKNPVTMAMQSASAPKTVHLQGLLYRLMMTVDDAQGVTSEIKAKIEKLGGTKAGQVELGWRKTNPDGSYFHFKMPEAHYNELITTLGGYGPVRIYKSPHERVMPPGEIRIILFIEDKAPATDGKAPRVETPPVDEQDTVEKTAPADAAAPQEEQAPGQ